MTESKREVISPHGHKRYVRRDSKGRFAETGEAGRALSRDLRQHASHDSKPGQGDRGDRRN